MKTKLLATFCRFCPVCIVARKFPESAFAKKVKELERNCPACRAYRCYYPKKSE